MKKFESDSKIEQYFGDMVGQIYCSWMRYVVDHFHCLGPIPNDEDATSIIEYETGELQRYLQNSTKSLWSFPNPTFSKAFNAAVEDGTQRFNMEFPDLVWNEFSDSKWREETMRYLSWTLSSFRKHKIEGSFCFMDNRNKLLAAAGHSQSALNGHHRMKNSELHNFVCTVSLVVSH